MRGGSDCAVTTMWPCEFGCGLLGAEGIGTEQWGQRELQAPKPRGAPCTGRWLERGWSRATKGRAAGGEVKLVGRREAA